MRTTLTTDRYLLGPKHGALLIIARREGAAAVVGHDVTLRATRWRATVIVDAKVPARSSVRARVDAGSLVVVEATGGAIGITPSQKDEIERNTREQVLESAGHPAITFASKTIIGDLRRASITGDLTIRGATRPATLEARVNRRAASPRIRATISIVQSEFGIKPYSALFGALRVRDAVEVVIDVQLHPRPA